MSSNMWVPAQDDPREHGRGWSGERAILLGSLKDHRLTFAMKCSGLDAGQLARRSVPPSNLSLLGLLRHLAEVERAWFRRTLCGQEAPWLYRTEEDSNAEFTGAVPDDGVVEKAWQDWRAEVAFAESQVAGIADLGQVGKHGDEVRGVLVHMIEEYARHNGHADLLRERIDGRVGQ
jgi:uncharacterized damage-inducible protein DinB